MVKLIQISNLSFSYGKKAVLSNLNLSVEEGEFLGVIGPVGSGKSTLLFTMNGVIPHLINGNFKGDVTVCGVNTRKTKVGELSKMVGIVLQDPNSQIFSLKVRDEVAFALENRKLQKDEIERRVVKYLKLFGLESMRDRDPNNLSEGQKQKLTLASTLATEPEIILLDEPSSNLDFGSATELYGMLKNLQREGRTIIVVEHDTEMLLDTATRIVVVKDGRIKIDGPAKKVLSDPRIERYGLRVPCPFKTSKPRQARI
jgi:energy-coupling factor transport system ATP-binding protein